MTARWAEHRVSDLQDAGCLLVEDGNHGEYRPRSEEFASQGVAFIRAADMDSGRVLFELASRINDVAVTRIRKGIGAGGDVLLSHKGTVGKMALVPLDAPPFVCSPQTTFWRSLDEDVIDRRYLYYYMKSDHFRRQIDARKGETDMADYVSLTAQRDLRILLPKINEQQAIGRILGAMDERITLNTRANHTLEATAQAIFKSWFVDFDPVVAKSEGRRPFGMEAKTAAVFPKSFIESDLGPLPCGWSLRPVSELIEGLYDGPHATPPPSDDGPVFLGIKNMTGTQIDLGEVRHISEDDWPRWTRRVMPGHGDIIFTYEAALGLFALIPPDLRCCLGRRMALVRPRNDLHLPHFLFHWFISGPFQELLDARSVQGSTVNRIPLLDFPKYPVVWPSEELARRFERLAEPIWARIHDNQQQIQVLSETRDVLLPRLLSGALRVKTAEKMLAEVP